MSDVQDLIAKMLQACDGPAPNLYADLLLVRDEIEGLREDCAMWKDRVDQLEHQMDGALVGQVIIPAELLGKLKVDNERLRAALVWEAACAGDECAYPRGQFCFEYEPESPDLWCTYCRITAALEGVENDKP